jgi:hypothetical protein
MNEDKGNISDGYHTFKELYEHRHRLIIALAKRCSNSWKSRLHSDGTMFKGWFVIGIGGLKYGDNKQITYHLPSELWRDCIKIQTLEKAPEYDGHSPNDVLERLKVI